MYTPEMAAAMARGASINAHVSAVRSRAPIMK